MHGDCLELMRNIPDGSVDMILSDLPYGMTRNEWDKPLDLAALWAEWRRVVKENGAIVLHCMQPFTACLIMSNLQDFRYCLVWNKKQITGFLNAKRRPLVQHEDIAIFYRKQATYNPQMTRGKMQLKNTGGASDNYNALKAQPHYSDEYYPKSILQIPLSRVKNGHPTQKPVALCEYLIRTYSNQGDIVLDNCMGSGTTGVACANTGRRFIGIEKDDHWFEVARDRIERAFNETGGDT